jgi:hypothetical protein
MTSSPPGRPRSSRRDAPEFRYSFRNALLVDTEIKLDRSETVKPGRWEQQPPTEYACCTVAVLLVQLPGPQSAASDDHNRQRRLIMSKSNRTSIFGSTDLLDRSTGSIPVVAFMKSAPRLASLAFHAPSLGVHTVPRAPHGLLLARAVSGVRAQKALTLIGAPRASKPSKPCG